MLKGFLFAAILMACPLAASAQGTVTVNPVYKKAQTLVNDGNAAAGRALVDSMVAGAAPGSNEFAEAVYWRAVLAATAAEAEMDYRRVVVDHPLSPRVEDALIRLAQLEIARGNYDGALRHLNRLATEHPGSPARARAQYWAARALFDKNDVQGGCTATSDALARTGENDTELRNQIAYLNQRCAGIVITGTVQAPTPQETSPVTTPATAPVAVPATSPVAPPVISPTPARDTVPTTRPAPTPPAPDMVVRNAAGSERTSETSSRRASGADRPFSVQIAAYTAKSQAEAMVARLRKNGYEARVDGTSAPFRVRIGRYATHAQAIAVQRSLKAKEITGIVVQADIR